MRMIKAERGSLQMLLQRRTEREEKSEETHTRIHAHRNTRTNLMDKKTLLMRENAAFK